MRGEAGPVGPVGPTGVCGPVGATWDSAEGRKMLDRILEIETARKRGVKPGPPRPAAPEPPAPPRDRRIVLDALLWALFIAAILGLVFLS